MFTMFTVMFPYIVVHDHRLVYMLHVLCVTKYVNMIERSLLGPGQISFTRSSSHCVLSTMGDY